MTKIAAFFLSFAVAPQMIWAQEQGYTEAMEYFVYREQKDRQPANEIKIFKGESEESANGLMSLKVKRPLKKQKFYIGGFFGKSANMNARGVHLGATFVKTRFLQQSLYLEYKEMDTTKLLAYRKGDLKEEALQSLFLFQKVKFASTLFFLGPEVAVGMGQSFGEAREGTAVALKVGLNLSNRWSKAMMMSASFNYRRDQYLSNNDDDEGVEFSLRFGF